ncbi:MAG: DUF1460 domain-containing protein, partial [Leptospiraceae bacterium]|nr:DUF1460 domain-containing protein [Leptospiraceae bacterium]
PSIINTNPPASTVSRPAPIRSYNYFSGDYNSGTPFWLERTFSVGRLHSREHHRRMQPSRPSRFHIDREQHALLRNWYARVGPRRAGESFGDLVYRTAGLQLGRPYYYPSMHTSQPGLRLRFDTFDCVSFIESSLAVARCVQAENPTYTCFMRDIIASRYRNGQMGAYADRLHYFTEWIAENARRDRLRDHTAELGGELQAIPLHFMTTHTGSYPMLRKDTIYQQVAATEKLLSALPVAILHKDRLDELETRPAARGDIVAIVAPRPGLPITHVGFFSGKDGRFLHASSLTGRVSLTRGSVAEYIRARPERKGVRFITPLPGDIKRYDPEKMVAID